MGSVDCATLIFGERDAVLVDALATVWEATALAVWVQLHNRRLTTIYITHAITIIFSGSQFCSTAFLAHALSRQPAA
jgi:hypothetical protein